MLGGAFDPPHLVHVALARCALDHIPLDQLRVVPTGAAWHKSRPLTDASHRLAMTRLAFADLPRAVIDDIELGRAGPSYTVETLRLWRQRWPTARLALILGADQGEALAGWHAWSEIFQLATIYVAPRAGCTGASDQAALPERYRAQLRTLPLPATGLSATMARTQAGQGQSLNALVPPAVARYIADHHLYTTSG